MRTAREGGDRSSLVRARVLRARTVSPGWLTVTCTFSGGISCSGRPVLHDVLVGQLVGELEHPILQPERRQHLIATPARLVRPLADDDVAVAHLVGLRRRGLAEREHVQGRAAAGQRFEHLLIASGC